MRFRSPFKKRKITVDPQFPPFQSKESLAAFLGKTAAALFMEEITEAKALAILRLVTKFHETLSLQNFNDLMARDPVTPPEPSERYVK